MSKTDVAILFKQIDVAILCATSLVRHIRQPVACSGTHTDCVWEAYATIHKVVEHAAGKHTTLHYTFFYIGLSHSEGARAAILNSLGTFMLVLLACMAFKSDRLTSSKIVGCVIGFAGILALNVGGGESGTFTLMGDGMIILNALCSAFAGLMTRGVSRRIDIVVGTGYSLAIGGLLLIIPGLALGGTLPHISMAGIIILGLLIAISTIGFSLYNKLLSCNPVGKVAIFNSLIPIVGALSSCLCLGEPFYWKYLLAALLATTGIYVINRGKK